jgi:type VI secretion system secreted protein Hcp
MKVRKAAWILVFVLTSSMFLMARPASAAIDAYLKIPGVEGSAKGPWAGWIAIESVNFPPDAARDAASGMASGKRSHQPFVVVKETDVASPKLFQAAASGQHFPTVQVAYVNAEGQVTKRAELSDVMLATRKAGGSGRQMEEIQFTFQKIALQTKEGKTTATDDWLSK